MTDSSITVLPSNGEVFSNEAAACGLLAEFYLHNPDVDFAKALGELIPEGFTDDSRIQTAVGILCTEAEKVRSNEEALLNLKRDWTKLFRGISPSYGPTAPYAFLFLKGKTVEMMGDLAALYIDGGYDGYMQIHDRIDYIGTCLRFLMTVDLQIVHAIETKAAVEYSRLSLCRKVFLETYLMPWVFEFTARAREHAQTHFYRSVLDLTDLVLNYFAGAHKKSVTLMSAEESKKMATAEEKEIQKMVANMERGQDVSD